MTSPRLKEWRKLVKTEKIHIGLWNVHFSKRPDKCTCKDCLDYKKGECIGIYDPFLCMQNFIEIEV